MVYRLMLPLVFFRRRRFVRARLQRICETNALTELRRPIAAQSGCWRCRNAALD